ncbi:leucine-rich repeat domain-containing protein [Tenacibaculum maritimum]|uniref:Uncharacterized protein n=1 Tax=Tenacibaculum maritimum NCIMB 2154 TaxID=1349785 RepID=A0A2H1EC89_9FLAO|nr:hypothetical protein [Tenacibaculum maritimum]SFZ84239.1 protein of unknown function [Tenacibaculum maritimum NCIMB 2154]
MKTITTFCYIFFITSIIFSQETIRIPDIGLEEALIDLNIDTNGLNGNILMSEAENVVNLNINDPLTNKLLPNVHSKIKDLTGLERFPNLKRLDCFGNNIKKLDLSKSTSITFLNCNNNKIEQLDLSNNLKLTYVSCDNNKLTSLILGEKPELVDLYCSNNKLTELNVKGCQVLENLDASNNKIRHVFIDKEIYKKYSDSWYLDPSAVYTETLAGTTSPTVITSKKESVVKTTKNQSNNHSIDATESAANHYQKFQLSVIAEYDQLVLASSHLQSKENEIQQKYGLQKLQLTQWIASYSNFKKTAGDNTSIEAAPLATANTTYAKFKQLVVNEYEQMILTPSYLLGKKEELQKKYGLDMNDLTKWIAQLGNPAFQTKQPINESTQNYYTKFKKLVVSEYEQLVLAPSYLQEITKKIQQKYSLNPTQLTEWIAKYSKIKKL